MPASQPAALRIGDPLADLLQRVADELRHLSHRTASLGDLPALQGPATCETMILAQDIDLITQSLASLSLFTAALGADIPRVWDADVDAAAAQVTLSDLQNRLTGRARGRADQSQADSFDLF